MPPVPVGLSHDNPHIVPPESCRYDASIHVAGSVTEDDGMLIQEVTAGSYACHIHVGDFRKIGETLFKMFGQIEADGISIRDGAVLEFHLDQPGEAPPGKLRTKLCIPVK